MKTSTATILIVLAFVLGGLGMFYAKESSILAPSGSPTPTGSAKPVITIQAKHSYQEGTHTYEGTVALPTPCHRLLSNYQVAESQPERITINLMTRYQGESCAQVITDRPFWVTLPASRNASVNVTYNEQPAAFELFEVEKDVVVTSNISAPLKSPLVIRGKAKGPWFFEASFPITLKDETGRVLAQVPAQAEGEWMTTNFVPFLARLEFTKKGGYGTLIIEKDNPSGLPEHAKSYEIPVVFGE